MNMKNTFALAMIAGLVAGATAHASDKKKHDDHKGAAAASGATGDTAATGDTNKDGSCHHNKEGSCKGEKKKK